MITGKQFIESAKRIGCPVAAVKAVAEVESGGSGFLPTGEPVILFEPHIFWKRLRAYGVDPAKVLKDNPQYADILYPVWGSRPYGKSSVQHNRLKRACLIHRDAALESASWGKFQILGMNWKACGVATLQEFINGMFKDEDKHLELFTEFVISSHLDDELRELD